MVIIQKRWEMIIQFYQMNLDGHFKNLGSHLVYLSTTCLNNYTSTRKTSLGNDLCKDFNLRGEKKSLLESTQFMYNDNLHPIGEIFFWPA